MTTIQVHPGHVPQNVGSDTTLLFDSGTYPNLPPIHGTGQNIRLAKNGNGPSPRLEFSAGGLRFGDVHGLEIADLDIVLTGHADPDPHAKNSLSGIEIAAKSAANIAIARTLVQGFEWNISLHHPAFDVDPFAHLPPDRWIQNVTLDHVRSLDARSPKTFGAQTLYAHGVNGLKVVDSVFDCAGFNGDATHPPSVYSHDLYLAFHTAEVALSRNIISRAGMYGAQCRGGGQVNDNLFNDCATAALINGPGPSSFQRNAIVAGHWTSGLGGQKGCEWCCGSGVMSGNLFIPANRPTGRGYDLGPAFQLHNRPKKQGWEYQGPTGCATGNNVEAPHPIALPVDFITRARAGQATAAEGIAYLRKAAGL